MDLILTHEQADFDALGALVAAHLLFDAAKPVLPRRFNQNVRKFINLYKNELGFFDFEDLPGQPIESVVLVDTQSLVTLKNFHKDATVLIIDHHAEKPDLPVTWKRKIEKVGATTTILVQQLKEENIHFSALEATVMLLGIHEDTGSLTYASTTISDIYAGAFLMEQGADLGMLADYLNPPLSPGQMALADDLLKNAQITNIKGKKILLSQALNLELEEEVSSIAHKIRDLMDPDALFLLVRNKEGLRLVARSTTDDVDVSQVALLFGGGGHTRASAALIHSNDDILKNPRAVESVISQITDFLQQTIKPSLTVAKIMSKKPLLITKETSIKDAMSMMKRYGYEGYPVVEGNTVVGLLTRRAVDKAANHKLDLSAGSLMDAGSFTLTPEQNLDDVQELMANAGWGQIPVVDPNSNVIIGIVTRTDLLKNLHKLTPKKASSDNFAQRFEKAISPGMLALLSKVIEVANSHHLPIYTVGGVVRDMLLDKPAHDLDVVVEGDAVKIANELARKYGGRVVSHRRFGTAKWQIKDIREKLTHDLGITDQDANSIPEFLDLISARTEFYERPSAMPIVKSSSIKLDLLRRDFTINTLALRLDGSHYGELIDHYGGLEDLRKKKIRVLHSLSFVDDPTRMLRAVRFEQRFAFQIEERTLQLMEEARPMLRQVSGDRLRHEFDLTFREPLPSNVLARLSALNLLAPIHQALRWDTALVNPLARIEESEPETFWQLPSNIGNLPIKYALYWLAWLGGLPEGDGIEISQRLKFPAPLATCLRETSKILPVLAALVAEKPSTICSRLDTVPASSLYAAFLIEESNEVKQKLRSYTQKWKLIQPVTNGDDLRNEGILPGPEYKRILNTLRAAYLDGIIATDDEEKQLLQYMIQQD